MNNGAVAEVGALEFNGFFTAGDEQHLRLRGASVSRSLGISPLDLNAESDFYFSMFVHHNSRDGADAGSEFLDILLQDAAGQTRAAFGVGSNDNFFVNHIGGAVSSAPGEAVRDTTYLLLAKIAVQNDSEQSNFDQLFLAWYDDPEEVPADESDVS